MFYQWEGHFYSLYRVLLVLVFYTKARPGPFVHLGTTARVIPQSGHVLAYFLQFFVSCDFLQVLPPGCPGGRAGYELKHPFLRYDTDPSPPLRDGSLK